MKNDTIVALATPLGVSAIAVVRLSGPEALQITNRIFTKDISNVPSHSVHFGKIKSNDTYIDECIVSIFKNPSSYTKENITEISCHGSPYIIERIIQLCIDNGARLAKKGEFTLRAFLNGQLDLSQAEAVADLISSDNEAAHQLAMRQLRGGYSNRLQQLRNELIDLASLLELELDFGEEDVEFASRVQLNKTIQESLSVVIQLALSFEKGNVIKNGIKAAIIGAPNAGKSTLLNALLNTDRAIVSDIPGTTRDTIEDQLILDGHKFLLTDTAGIRESSDTIEEVGIKRSKDEIKKSRLVVLVLDVSTTAAKDAAHQIDALNIDRARLILVLNKMDLWPTAKISEYEDSADLPSSQVVPLSAKNKMNLGRLTEVMVLLSLGDKVDNTIVTNSRHYSALLDTQKSLEKALHGLEAKVSTDLIAMDIRHSLHSIGEITGEVYTDDLLENIFSNFCIGK